MKIWLLTIGEPVPLGAGVRDRLHRTGAFARYLVSRGHEVTWWTSAFDHFRKQHLAAEDTFLTEPDGLGIRLLRARVTSATCRSSGSATIAKWHSGSVR